MLETTKEADILSAAAAATPRDAAAYLEQGFSLVMVSNDTTIFGGAAAAVDDRKQQQIRSLAESWLRLHGDAVERVRFDVIAIEGVHLTHLEAAF